MDWPSILSGGAVGFLSSFGVMTAERIWDKAGKLKIYYTLKNCRNETSTLKQFGFTKCSGGISFVVPITLDIQNTSNTSRVIRDLRVALYNNGKYIDEMYQIKQITKAPDQDEGAEKLGNGKKSYSFVIPQHSIQTEICIFDHCISESEIGTCVFNEIRLRYFDEHDREVECHLEYIDHCWELGEIPVEGRWTLVGKRKKFQPVESDNGEVIPFTPEKISYLQMIQEPISRMSNISAIMKGFAAAMTGVVATLLELEVSCWLLLMVSIPLFMFACLDIYYLKLEKKYRYLYECVRTDQHAVDFSMKLSKDNRKAGSRVIDCLKSTSIWLFYLVLFAALAAIVYLKWKGII